MIKLIKLKNSAGETIYPSTLFSNVLDNNGGNIEGYVDDSIGKINKSLQKDLVSVITEQEKIRLLDGFSDTTKSLSQKVSNIIKHCEKINSLIQRRNNIDITVSQSDKVNLSDIYNETGIINTTSEIISEKVFIKFCNVPPKYAPINKQIKICSDGYAYIGTGGVWYKVFLNVNPVIPNTTITKYSDTRVSFIIDTDWILSINIWEGDNLLAEITENTEINLSELSNNFENLVITANLVYEADTLRFILNGNELSIEPFEGKYLRVFDSSLVDGSTVEIKTYNSDN